MGQGTGRTAGLAAALNVGAQAPVAVPTVAVPSVLSALNKADTA